MLPSGDPLGDLLLSSPFRHFRGCMKTLEASPGIQNYRT